MPRKLTLNGLKKKAWKKFSEYIRYGDSDHRGMVRCVSCSREFHWKEVHAGHLVHGGKGGDGNAVSYDERNIHCQCSGCNYYGMSGEASVRYAAWAEEHYGRGIVEELIRIKHQSKMKRCEFERIVEYYDKQIELLKRLNRS